ncbi:hypothetical protein M9458_040171, partial [Cirrhinus mrigala]
RAHGTGLSHPHWHALSRSDERHCARLPVPEDRHLLCLSAVRNLAYPLSPRRNLTAEGTGLLRRVAHQQSPALAHPGHGHAPVCTPTSYSVTDPRRYHCLSLG